MIAAAYDFETERAWPASVTPAQEERLLETWPCPCKRSQSTRDGDFGDERFKDWATLSRAKRLSPERLDMKRDGRAHVGQCRFVSIALAEDRPAPKPQRVGHIAIGVFLNHQPQV